MHTRYVECTSAATQGLLLFKKQHPSHRREEIESSIERAIQYLESVQQPDGSWYAHWGICYTYATWFAVEALVASGKTYHNSQALRKASHFLLSKQLPDGGWGESYLSNSNKVNYSNSIACMQHLSLSLSILIKDCLLVQVYTNLEGNRSNLVQTSWALLALIAAGQVHTTYIYIL